jgi:hypothetical protein
LPGNGAGAGNWIDVIYQTLSGSGGGGNNDQPPLEVVGLVGLGVAGVAGDR